MSDAAWRRIAGIEGVYIGRNFNSVLNGRHCYKAIVNEAVTAANVNITDSAFNDVTSDYIDTANVTTLIPGTTITFKSPIYSISSIDGSFIFVLDGENATGLLLLNTYPATAAYSLRLLDNSYTGSAIRVRRASDNAEQDIGFSGSDLDTASLTSFCTGTNGFVTTWYDQAGSNDATQATAGAQPKIYDSSTGVVLENGKPAIDFGGNDFIQTPSTVTNSGDTSIFAVSRADTSVDAFRTIAGQWIGASTRKWLLSYSAASLSQDSLFLSTNDGTANNTPSITGNNDVLAQKLSAGIAKSVSTELFVNGVSAGIEVATGLESTALKITIGAQEQTIGFFGYLDGKIQELVVFASDQSANRTAIESNINSHYSIYP